MNSDCVTIRARAKINLTLDVTGVRADGYHLVRMIMQSVALHDTVRLTAARESGLRLRADSAAVPADSTNLMWRAAELLIKTCGIRSGLDMELRKRIPVAAGMAGGSTDAAAVFVGMNELFSLGLGREELMRLALPLGADIPYCIMGGTALAEGIGEILTPLPDMPACSILIARPDIEVSTGSIYHALDRQETVRHPDTDRALLALKDHSLRDLAGCMDNVLEDVAAGKWPVITEIRHFMQAHGAVGACMSGSGPTVFGLYTEKAAAENALEKLRDAGLASVLHLTEPYPQL